MEEEQRKKGLEQEWGKEEEQKEEVEGVVSSL